MTIFPANLMLLLPPALTLMLAVRFLTFLYGGSGSTLSVRMMRFTSHVMLALSGVGFFWSMQRLLIPSAPVFLAILLAVLSIYRRTQQGTLLSGLALAHTYNLPLPLVVDAIAQDQRGWMRKRLVRLSNSLKSGVSLDRACVTHRLAPTCAVRLALIDFYDSEQAPAALRNAITDDDRIRVVQKNANDQLLYLFILLTVSILLLLFYFTNIIRNFSYIAIEFGLLDNWDPFVKFWLQHGSNPVIWQSLLASVIFLLLVVMPIGGVIYLGWFPKNWYLSRLWNRDYYTSQILRAVSRIIVSGKPLDHGLLDIASAHPVFKHQLRLEKASHEIQGGRNWIDSIYHSKLISKSYHDILAGQKTDAGLAKTLEYLAQLSLRKQLWKSQRLSQIVAPIGLIALTAFIGLPAYFTIAVLYEMISQMSLAY